MEWSLTQATISKRTTQVIIGKVIHISACVPSAHTFINHILQALRDAHGIEQVPVGEGMRQDLMWFRRFLRKFNGTSMMKPDVPQFIIDADACPTGGGATDYNAYIAYVFPEKIADMNISVLEALNCLVACRVLLSKEKHSSTVKIRCDNMATIETFSRGSPRDKFLAGIA